MDYLKEKYFIRLIDLEKYKENLLKCDYLSEENIKFIFIKTDDNKNINIENMKYIYNLPLYCKMIFRFREGLNTFQSLFRGCDVENKNLLINFIGGKNYFNFEPLNEFFASFINFYKRDEENKKKYVKICSWFFNLNVREQVDLINQYNSLL